MSQIKTQQNEDDFRNESPSPKPENNSDLRQTLHQVGKRYQEESDIPKSFNLNDLLSANYNNTHME